MILTVGMADMKASADREDVLITHALGSCLGIAIYDPVAGVGAMLHAMLPESAIDPRKALENPYMFIDTGVPALFKETYRLGADKKRLVVKVAGGATSKANLEDDYFQIGKRNFIALRHLLWKNNVLLKTYDVGGNQSRTMTLRLGDGQVLLKISGVATPL
ncbi:MAG: chemotaxis protein CheD [Candidatus Eisenbacteria bacterium]|nr:chemotaxis protein CheD [Candidatus Eisenbacteria bacterium]